jgi:rhodanese-related sulfurtransferase
MLSRLFHRSARIDAGAAAALFAEGRAVPFDVREKHEWKAGRISGASHVPLGSLAAKLAANKIPSGQTVICVCQSGMRSARAQSLLERHGFEALNLSGGMRRWRAAGLPEVTR